MYDEQLKELGWWEEKKNIVQYNESEEGTKILQELDINAMSAVFELCITQDEKLLEAADVRSTVIPVK